METIPVAEEAHAAGLARGGRAGVPGFAARPPLPARLRPRRPDLQQVPGAGAPVRLGLLHGAAARAAPAGAAAAAGGARHAPDRRRCRLHRPGDSAPRTTNGEETPSRLAILQVDAGADTSPYTPIALSPTIFRSIRCSRFFFSQNRCDAIVRSLSASSKIILMGRQICRD